MIVTFYHKGVRLTDQLKVTAQFLCERVSKLLVICLTDVLPFRQLMDRNNEILVSKGFLWFKENKPWNTRDLSQVFTRESGMRLGLELKTSDYKHIAIEIDREHRSLILATILLYIA